jgi:hypothetical protein
MKLILRLLIFLALPVSALADPRLTSWYTLNPSQAARLYRSDADLAAGQTETTWSNGRQTQAQPVQTGIRQILYSTNWIYIGSSGLPSQVMGPWYLDADRTREFPNLPTDQHMIFCLPRHPVMQNSFGFQHLGEIGITVDGVRIFDANDSFSYSNADGRDADPRAGIMGHGDQFWERDAMVNEGVTFDPGMGHQQNWGTYHYHAEAIALRYELGDHVDFDPATKTYRESAGAPEKHSPIIGWLRDGYPLYGPYGYSNPTNPASGVRRMISGFVPRNGENGSDDLAQTGRTTLPAWAAREWGRSAALTDDQTGPNVSAYYPIGHYLQDYAYLGDLGKVRGRDFDLDELNGRWCVTPEFPQGTYAYFTTIDASGKPVYPYAMGKHFRGRPTGGLARSLHESVTAYFTSTAAAPAGTGAAPPQNATTSLIWHPTNGGDYQPSSDH